ncbi:MAG: dienelactone hydrolase family protein [Nevskia sp.]
MAIVNRLVDYQDQGTALQGRVYHDDSLSGPRPVVLVAHQWGGRSEFTDGHAETLAKLGYLGFALDLFGTGVRGATVEECSALIGPFMQDRALLARRVQAGLATARTLPGADAARAAAIGFCFGGLTVLDLARSGADLRGVVSFHGLLKPSGLPKQQIRAKVLVLHGDADPMAPVEDYLALRQELDEAGADWQVHVYGRTLHAFSDPGANLPEMGIKHSTAAERRSNQAMRDFLAEVLA